MTSRRPRITLIAAVAANGVIGHHNGLPWSLPADLKHFKKRTLGRPIIMGRKTWDSIGRKPLRDRRNIVITSNHDLELLGAERATDLEAALQLCAGSDEVMIVGGATIYALALPQADTLELTEIHESFEGDVLFPPWDRTHFRETCRVHHDADEKNSHAFDFVTFERRRAHQ